MTTFLIIGAGIGIGAGYFVWGSDGNNGSEMENIALSVDGVVPSAETVQDGTYTIYRGPYPCNERSAHRPGPGFHRVDPKRGRAGYSH